MKKTLILLIVFLVSIINVNGQSKSEFCKKWDLQGYVYWGTTLSPDKNEKNDFLHFHENGTFNSIDEGIVEKGTWKWNQRNKKLYLFDNKTEVPLIMSVVKMSNEELIVLLEDEEDSIKVKFVNTK